MTTSRKRVMAEGDLIAFHAHMVGSPGERARWSDRPNSVSPGTAPVQMAMTHGRRCTTKGQLTCEDAFREACCRR